MITLTFETLSSEDFFKTKLQEKFDKTDKIFKQLEGEFMDFIEQQHQQSNISNKNWLLSTQKHRASQKLLK